MHPHLGPLSVVADELELPPPTAPERGTVLIPWRRVPFPLDWCGVFGRRTALHLEVGFGDGRYTVRRALEAPEADYVGLEVSTVSVQRALARVRREGVANVRIAKVGAQVALRELFPEASLESITVNFPDPWPKERHEQHRLLRRPFFELAASRLVPGGEIRLASDHEDYVAFAAAEARANGRYSERDVTPPAAVFETKYALKWRQQGKPLYYRVWRLDRPTDTPSPHLERPTTMPHAFLSGSLPDASTLPSDAKRVVPYGDAHVIVHDGAQVFGARERWLFRVTVDEAELTQQLLVLAQRREGGEVIVRLERFGDPLITPAVRGAVHAVTEWLVEHAGLEVRERNY